MAKYTVPELHLSATNPKVPLQDLNMGENSASGSTVNPQTSHADDDSDDIASDPEGISISTDIAYDNIILLTRDLLYATELVAAMSDGDFGCIEDILPTLACMFQGAGSNNYSTEISISFSASRKCGLLCLCK